MTNVTPVKKKERIDLSKFVNTETGEIINREAIVERDTDYVVINYDEYIIIDSTAHSYLRMVLKPSEFALFIEMLDMIQTPFNVLCKKDKKTLHDMNSLQKELNQSKTNFYKIMNVLFKKGLIWYFIGYKNGCKVKRIVVNPNVARKRKTFDKELLLVFDNAKTLIEKFKRENTHSV